MIQGRKSRFTKEKCIAAYIKQCAKHGIGETTVAHTTDEMGASRGMVSFLFDSKDALTQMAIRCVLAKHVSGERLTLAEEKFTIQAIALAVSDKRIARLFVEYGLIFTLDVQKAGEA